MLNFKQWLVEMAMVSRQILTLDQDDIDYVKQFPLKDWGRALKLRYADLIFKATERGKLKKGWKDVQTLTITHYGLNYSITVDTKMSVLIEKLKQMGYDLSGTNPINKVSLYYNPITDNISHKIASKLINTISPEKLEVYNTKYKQLFSDKYGKVKVNIDFSRQENVDKLQELNSIIDPHPGVVTFSPNHMLQAQNDPEPGAKDTFELKTKFDQLTPQILQIIDTEFEKVAKSSKNPNIYHWSQSKNKTILKSQILDNIWLNWKNENLHSLKYLPKYIYNKIISKLQSGVISRRNDDSLKALGTNVHGLFQTSNPATGKNWGLQDIQNVLKTHKSHTDRHAAFGGK